LTPDAGGRWWAAGILPAAAGGRQDAGGTVGQDAGVTGQQPVVGGRQDAGGTGPAC